MELVLTLHCGIGLKESSFSSKMKPFVVISIDGCRGMVRTPTDKDHGSDPVWNYAVKFKFQPPFPVDADLVLEIFHKSSTKLDRKMGKVRIPLQNILSGEENAERVSHAVHLSNSVAMGQFIISHNSYIISSSSPQANDVPGIDVSSDNPPQPSRLSLENLRGFASCLLVAQGVVEVISGVIS